MRENLPTGCCGSPRSCGCSRLSLAAEGQLPGTGWIGLRKGASKHPLGLQENHAGLAHRSCPELELHQPHGAGSCTGSSCRSPKWESGLARQGLGGWDHTLSWLGLRQEDWTACSAAPSHHTDGSDAGFLQEWRFADSQRLAWLLGGPAASSLSQPALFPFCQSVAPTLPVSMGFHEPWTFPFSARSGLLEGKEV